MRAFHSLWFTAKAFLSGGWFNLVRVIARPAGEGRNVLSAVWMGGDG